MRHNSSFFAWYALHTKPKQEARAIANLSAWGIETFTVWMTPDDRKPLFPRYIFAHFDVTQMFHKISFTRGVISVVSFGGIPASVGDDVIAAMRSRTDQDGVIRPPEDLQPGDAVVIKSGRWKNIIGCFEKQMRAEDRVRILLTTVSYSVRIEVPKSEVAKLPPFAVQSQGKVA